MSTPQPVGFWLKLLDQLIDEQFAQTLTEHNVTRRQGQLLHVLSRADATLHHLNAASAPLLASDGTDSAAPPYGSTLGAWLGAGGSPPVFHDRGGPNQVFTARRDCANTWKRMAQGIEAGD